MFRKLILSAAMLSPLVLGGGTCLSNIDTGSTTVSAQTAYLAINAFNTVKGGATAYDSLPRCGAAGASSACNTLATVKAIDAAVRTATKPVRALQVLADAACGLPLGAGTTASNTINCAPVSITAYQAVEAAISTLQGAYAAYGIAAPTT
jgi:hypothetical protein